MMSTGGAMEVTQPDGSGNCAFGVMDALIVRAQEPTADLLVDCQLSAWI